MSFADEVRRNGRRPGGECLVALMFAEVDEQTAAEIAAVIGSPAYSTSAIVRALKARGLNASEASLGRHRREACRCSRTT